MKSLKKVCIALLVLLSMASLVACGSQNKEAGNNGANGEQTEAQGEKTDGKVYKVGLDDTFVPMGYRNEKGELEGFDVDLAKEAAKLMGIELEFTPVDWNYKEAELKAGNIDFIWNGYSITPEREKQVLFSKPYMDNRQIIIVPEDSPIEKKADFKGKLVTLQADSSALEAVQKDQEFVKSLAGPLVEYPTNIEAFKDVEAGRSDGIVVDEVLARDYLKKNPDVKMKILEDNFGDEQFAVGMRKDDKELAEKLDKALDTLKENGKFKEIQERYFN